jgi:acetyl esterase/lipase
MTDTTEHTVDGPHGPLRVRVYPAAAARAALVWAHGGGFAYGDLDMPEADHVARGLAARGVSVVSVDYPLAPAPADAASGAEARDGVHHPVALEQLAAAFVWTREQATGWGIAPDRVALGGASAGGNLATGAILHLMQEGDPLPALAVLAYPTLHAPQPPTPRELTERLAAAGLTEQFGPAVVSWMYENYLDGTTEGAPVTAIPGLAGPERLAGFPPAIVITSDADELRVSAEAFVDDLRAAGVDVEYAVEPGTTHGHLNDPEKPGAASTIEAFAARILRP